MKFWSILETFLARALAMAGPLGVSIITARALGPEDRGLYFIVISYAQIAAQIGNMGLHSSNTYLVSARPELVRGILTNSLIVSLVLGPIVASMFVWWPWANAAPDARGSILIAVIAAPLLILFLLVSNIAVAIGRVSLYNVLTLLAGILALSSSVVAALLEADVTQFLLAAAAATGLASIVGVVTLLPNCGWSLRPSLKLFLTGLSYSGRAYVATLAGFVMNRVGILILETEVDMSVVGHFSIAQQITEALVLLPSTVGLLLKPSLLRIATRAERAAETRRIALKLTAAMAILLLLLAAVTPFFLPLFFGADYQAAVPYALSFLPSVLMLSLVIPVSQFLSAEGFPRGQVAVWILATVLHAIMVKALIPHFGVMAIPLSFTLNTALILLGLILVAVHMTRRDTPDA